MCIWVRNGKPGDVRWSNKDEQKTMKWLLNQKSRQKLLLSLKRSEAGLMDGETGR